MSVESTIRDEMDHLARCIFEVRNAFTHSPSLFSIVDGAADEDYECACKNRLVSSIDDVLDDPETALRSLVWAWSYDKVNYAIEQGFTYTYGGTSADVLGFDDLLNSYMWRCPQEIAELLPVYPDPELVFTRYPSGDSDRIIFNVFEKGDSTPTSETTSLDTDKVTQGKFYVKPENTIGADWTLTYTATLADSSIASLTFVVPNGSTTSQYLYPHRWAFPCAVASGQYAIPLPSGGASEGDSIPYACILESATYDNLLLLEEGTTNEIVRIKSRTAAQNDTAYTSASQAVITMPSGHGLSAGDKVFISDCKTGTDFSGVNTITAVGDTSITVDADTSGGPAGTCDVAAYVIALDVLRNSWTTSGKINSLVQGISVTGESGGDTGDEVSIVGAYDRAISQ